MSKPAEQLTGFKLLYTGEVPLGAALEIPPEIALLPCGK